VPVATTLLPIACTLGVVEGPQRLREWQELAAAGMGRETTAGKVTLIF
jgi:hypothetical protein